MRLVRRLSTVVSLVVMLGACSGGGGTADTVINPDTTAGEFDGVSYAGTTPAPEFPDGLDWLNVPRPLSVAELRGKVVLLDFWTYGCINCIHIIPDLKRLEAEYPDELVVIGVHSAKFANEGETSNIRNIIARYGLEHPVVNDRDFAVWEQWGVNAWPTLVLIDPAGNIVGGHSGEGIYPVFQPVIDALVEEFDLRGQIDRDPIALEVSRPAARVLSFPGKIHADPAGERLFVADTNHHRVLVVDAATGRVLDVAGSGGRGYGDGGFDSAAFDQPQGLALSADGSILYVADLGNHAVRALDLITRSVTTLAGSGEQSPVYPPNDGPAAATALSSPWDLLLVDEVLYVAMAGSHQIWTIDLATGAARAVAGSGREDVGEGPARDVGLAQPSGLATDGTGNIFFADAESSSIRVLTAERTVVDLAGADRSLFDFGLVDGVGNAARFQHPLGVAYTAGRLFIADTYNSAIRVIDTGTREVTTFAGGESGWSDGAAPRFNEPGGISIAGSQLFVADTNNHAIRVVDLVTGAGSTLVLFGIEEYRMPVLAGEVTTLDAVMVAPGDVAVTIEVRLPEGYVLNDRAPLSVSWAGPAVQGELTAIAPALPLRAILTGLTSGTEVVRFDLTVYYCTAAAKELCLIDQASYELPLTIVAGGLGAPMVVHTVANPGR